MIFAFSGCRAKEVESLFLDYNVENEPFEPSILVGDCPTGVDKCVRKWARAHKYPLAIYKADWDKHGKAAGPIRNEAMVQDADILVAYWDGKSRGTKSAIMSALKHKVTLKVYYL